MQKKADIIEQFHLISATGNYALDEMMQNSDTNMTDTEALWEKYTDIEKDTDTEEPGIIITENLTYAVKLDLSEENRGRLVTFVRDPVEREFENLLEVQNTNNNADPRDKNFNLTFKDQNLRTTLIQIMSAWADLFAIS